jgi:hypothetical protein
MKVYLSKYRNHWISPYTICERVCWWREIDYDEPWVKTANRILEPACEVLKKILDWVHPEIRYVKIDRWDTWNMDSALTPIILPMLRQLQLTKHGSPHVADEDVPEHLRSTAAPPKADEWDTDELWHDRWTWVLDQMIWSFEQLNSDWEAQFHSGEHDIYWEKTGETSFNPITNKMEGLGETKHGPNHSARFDAEGYRAHNDQIDLGLRLFGKYFRALWD